MDLRDLQYFETIAKLEHLGRASQQLHRTQPALTSCIRRLEEQCGAVLFERSGRGIRLTAAGHALLRWAERTRFDVESARREIADIGRGVTGNVRIGVVPTAAQFLLPPAARDLIAEAPSVTLTTHVALVDVLKPLLRAGKIDLLVGTESTQDAAGFTSRFLAEDLIVVAAAQSHEIFRRKRPTLKDLTHFRWVLQPPGAPTRDWLDHTFDANRLPRPEVQVDSTMLLILPTLIEETGLLSFISRLHLQAGRSGAALREVKVPGTTMRRRMVVTYREGGYLPPAAQRLVDLLARHAVAAGKKKAAS